MTNTISDSIRRHLVCNITLEIPELPVVCPCGHLFDYVAIVQALAINAHCPVSREPLRMNQLTFVYALGQFFDSLHLGDSSTNSATQTDIASNDVSMGTDDDEQTLPTGHTTTELVLHSYPFHPLPEPFVYIGDDCISLSNLNEVQTAYIGDGRLVDLHDGLFNPSSLSKYVGPTVDTMNYAYISKLIPKECRHPHVIIRKFATSHTSESLVEVARHFARAGYFIYDIIRINKKGNHWAYIIYSTDVLSNGIKHNMSRFYRISNRTD